ncbi:MAG: hypothetical protein VCF25_12155 [Candidatus Poribacteria bacterium]|jgi:hypothetical protein
MKDKKTKRQILIHLTEQNYLKAIEACDVMKDENINRFVNLIIERYADDFIVTELKHNSAKSLNLKKNVPDLDV